MIAVSVDQILPSRRRGKLKALLGLSESTVPSKAVGTGGLLKHTLMYRITG